MLSPFLTNGDAKSSSANENDSVSLLKELEKIRAEIEHDLATSPIPFSAKAICNEPFALSEKYELPNDLSNELPPYEPEQRYNKLEKKEDADRINNIKKQKRKNGLDDKISDLVKTYKKQRDDENPSHSTLVSYQMESFQEEPMVIPIRSKRQSPLTYHQPHVKLKRIARKIRRRDKRLRQDVSENNVAPMISWKWLSQYESESTMRLASNFGAILTLVGWIGAACGTMIFLRAFFTASKSWTIYGIPLFAIGLFCLALGIILHILSDKMRQVNELKQTLTAQRIRHSSNKPQRPLRSKQQRQPLAKKKDSKVNANLIKKDDEQPLQSIYHRLLELKGEVNDLLDQYKNHSP
ncbi:MAG: hypothetical protein LBT05_15840 [Planctomycetaceae bacterium]|jgi:hypothetical protein|nr:hypothetical protein [Planctomycetaceae bacterium]